MIHDILGAADGSPHSPGLSRFEEWFLALVFILLLIVHARQIQALGLYIFLFYACCQQRGDDFLCVPAVFLVDGCLFEPRLRYPI